MQKRKCMALLLAFGSCSDSNVTALCTYTYRGEEFTPGSGVFTGCPVSYQIESDTMGLWAEQVGGVQDEFSIYLDTLLLGEVKFYGSGDHRNFTILDPVPEDATEEEFVVVVWCNIGSNSTGKCTFDRTNWTIADCQACPSGSVRQYGECSVDTPPTDTVCLVDCPPGPGSIFSASDGGSTCQLCRPGSFQDSSEQKECLQCPSGTFSGAFAMTQCEPCPLGTYGSNGGEWRATCSGPCPAKTYGSSVGLTRCADCPYQYLAPTTSAPEPIGLISIDECSDFQTSGFWLPVGSGSLAGGGSWTSSFSRGVVDLNRTRDEFDALKQEVASALRNGAYFETSSMGEWAIKAGSQDTLSFSRAANYSADIGATNGEFFMYEVSESVRNNLSAAVASSIMEYSDDGCELECPQLPGNPAMTAYGWRWIQLIFESKQGEVVMAVETCETQCLYQQDDFPQCPPGRCDNDNCAVCIPGSFAKSEIDKIASLSDTLPAPTTQPAPTPGGSEGISTGAVVGIALGGVAIAVVVVMASFRLGRKRGNGILYNDTPLVAEPIAFPVSARPAPSPTPEPSTIIAHVLPFSDGDSVFDGEVRAAPASKDVGPQYKDQVREADRAGAAQLAHSSSPQYKDQVRDADRAGAAQLAHSSGPQYKDQVREADRAGAAQLAHSSGPQYKDQVREADRAGTQGVHSSSPQYKEQGSSPRS